MSEMIEEPCLRVSDDGVWERFRFFPGENAMDNDFHDFHGTNYSARVACVNRQQPIKDWTKTDQMIYLLTAAVDRYLVHTNHVLRRYHGSPFATDRHRSTNEYQALLKSVAARLYGIAKSPNRISWLIYLSYRLNCRRKPYRTYYVLRGKFLFEIKKYGVSSDTV